MKEAGVPEELLPKKPWPYYNPSPIQQPLSPALGSGYNPHGSAASNPMNFEPVAGPSQPQKQPIVPLDEDDFDYDAIGYEKRAEEKNQLEQHDLKLNELEQQAEEPKNLEQNEEEEENPPATKNMCDMCMKPGVVICTNCFDGQVVSTYCCECDTLYHSKKNRENHTRIQLGECKVVTKEADDGTKSYAYEYGNC